MLLLFAAAKAFAISIFVCKRRALRPASVLGMSIKSAADEDDEEKEVVVVVSSVVVVVVVVKDGRDSRVTEVDLTVVVAVVAVVGVVAFARVESLLAS